MKTFKITEALIASLRAALARAVAAYKSTVEKVNAESQAARTEFLRIVHKEFHRTAPVLWDKPAPGPRTLVYAEADAKYDPLASQEHTMQTIEQLHRLGASVPENGLPRLSLDKTPGAKIRERTVRVAVDQEDITPKSTPLTSALAYLNRWSREAESLEVAYELPEVKINAGFLRLTLLPHLLGLKAAFYVPAAAEGDVLGTLYAVQVPNRLTDLQTTIALELFPSFTEAPGSVEAWNKFLETLEAEDAEVTLTPDQWRAISTVPMAQLTKTVYSIVETP